MTIKASFIPGAHQLSVFGDTGKNTATLSRNAAGQILVNGGAVAVVGGTPTVANTTLIDVFGQGGDDTITLDEANGALPAAHLFGGDGNDVITGGSGADLLFGQSGNDTLLGKGGDDQLFGGSGNDTLTGGSGDDQVFGEAGNDHMIWNPGDGTDLFEGGTGTDTAVVNGGNGSEVFTVTANGTRVRFDRVTPAPFSLDIGTTEELVVNANGGDDVITAGTGLANLIHLTIDGGAGNDTITGGDGDDMLLGGDGNDFVDGNQGADVAFLGAGDDVFQWDPGDGSDAIEGQGGTDTLIFNGSNIAEEINISANGGRGRLTRNIGNVTMDFDDVERLQLNMLSGADAITVNDLTGTDVQQVAVDLAGVAGSGIGDGAADTVTVNGTGGGDQINVANNGSSILVTGLPAQVSIDGAEAANDSLMVKGLGGNDTINAATLAGGHIKLAIDGGTGNDTILGSGGDDMLAGGEGNDFVDGNQGSDVAFLGAGNDVFQWDPGDGSDVVEGQAGTDTLVFNGSNAAETIDISANGNRARLFRNVGSITMDLNDVEHLQLNALGAADAITINDLTGTDLKQVAIDLSATIGSGQGDAAADTVTVDGTAGNDKINVASSGNSVTVKGLPAQVTVNGIDADATDSLVIDGLNGNDTIDASKLAANLVKLTIKGGGGNDTVIGSAGNDVVNGGIGSDVALLGAGDDEFVWNPGDGSDVVEGQSGLDTLTFKGANIDEKFDISANGSRVRMTRDIGIVTMDVNGTETINLHALGGADTITVGDLSGTDVTGVNIDLGADGGDDDGSADTIVINATEDDDVISISSDNGVVTVHGLGEDVTISNFGTDDHLVINGLGGDDVIEASGLGAGILLTANGGDGDDVLIGGAGNDTLTGGAGDDILNGGPGQDVLDPGPGDNVTIQFAVSNVADDGSHAAALLGQFMASTFVASGASDATPVADPAMIQQPLLAQPHA